MEGAHVDGEPVAEEGAGSSAHQSLGPPPRARDPASTRFSPALYSTCLAPKKGLWGEECIGLYFGGRRSAVGVAAAGSGGLSLFPLPEFAHLRPKYRKWVEREARCEVNVGWTGEAGFPLPTRQSVASVQKRRYTHPGWRMGQGRGAWGIVVRLVMCRRVSKGGKWGKGAIRAGKRPATRAQSFLTDRCFPLAQKRSGALKAGQKVAA